MFDALCHHAVPLSQAGREGRGGEGRQPGPSPAPCPGCAWGCRSHGAQEKVSVALKRGQPAGPARMGLDQNELMWSCLNLQCP